MIQRRVKNSSDKCDFSSHEKANFEKHLYQHGKTKPFQCDKCEKAYVTKPLLETHKINYHTDSNAFPCTFCKVSFKSKPGLDYHTTVTHSERTKKPIEWLECDICFEFKAKHKNGLAQHKYYHKLKEKSTKCEICGKGLVMTSLKGHMKNVHGGDDSPLLKCDECSFETKYKTELKKHNERIHLRIRHKCDRCTKDFGSARDLRDHLKRMHSFE